MVAPIADWCELFRLIVTGQTPVSESMHRTAPPRSQQALAREMANCISPRPGYTPHALTIHAAEQMRSMSNRADRP